MRPKIILSVFQDRVRSLCTAGDHAQALLEADRLIEESGDAAAPWLIRASILRDACRFGEAAGAYSEAAKRDPTDPAVWFGVGLCLEQSGESAGALQAYEKTRKVDPTHPGAAIRYAHALLQNGQPTTARALLESSPNSIQNCPESLQIIWASALELGDYHAISHPTPPQERMMHTVANLGATHLRARVYDPVVDRATLLRTAKAWAHRHGALEVTTITPCDTFPDRTLRIGFVNTRMGQHNVGLQQLALQNHRPSKEEMSLHLFAGSSQRDRATEILISTSDSFDDITELGDEEAAQFIRERNIDILIDFNEFANGGRMGLFARRAAPIQIHYYGNSMSTGVPAMDYRISDDVTDPVEFEAEESSERVIRLDSGYHMFTPPSDPKLSMETPAISRGYITFGATHHLAKYNSTVLETFAQILHQLPTSRLLLVRNTFADLKATQAFGDLLRKHRLPLDRVSLRTDAGSISDLSAWQDIDCMLDAFPFGGDATTMESLYAGVPMVTLLGERIAGRRSAAMAHQVGHPEFVAKSLPDYISKAVSLGNDIQKLSSYRRSLHQEVSSSSLINHKEPADSFYKAIRQIWQNHYS